MKPCRKYRELIAWLTLDQLEADDAARLQLHLEHCEACRAYAQEMSRVVRVLGKTKVESTIEASKGFHQRLVRALTTVEPHVGSNSFLRWWQTTVSNSRLKVPALGMALLVVIGLIALVWPTSPHSQAPVPLPAPVAKAGKSELAPSVSNYRMVASQSFDRFDDLLTEQAARNPNPTPIYTASGSARPPD